MEDYIPGGKPYIKRVNNRQDYIPGKDQENEYLPKEISLEEHKKVLEEFSKDIEDLTSPIKDVAGDIKAEEVFSTKKKKKVS
jgi:hypothetical protein